MVRFTESGFNNNSIMAGWITFLKKKLLLNEEKRKVVLILNSAACHQSEDIEKAIKDSNIEIISIPGGCTGFLQPIDTAVNKGLKDRIKQSYHSWIDFKSNNLKKDVAVGTHLTTTKSGNFQSPSLDNIRDRFLKALQEESPQRIINAFIPRGITYEMHELFHLNQQL